MQVSGWEMSTPGYRGPGDRPGDSLQEVGIQGESSKWTQHLENLCLAQGSAGCSDLRAGRHQALCPGWSPLLVQKFSARPSASVTGKAWKPSKKGNGQEGIPRETTAPWRRTDGTREADWGGTWGPTSVPRTGGGHMPHPASVPDAGTAHTLLTFPSGHRDLTATQGSRACVLGTCPLLAARGGQPSPAGGEAKARCRGRALGKDSEGQGHLAFL